MRETLFSGPGIESFDHLTPDAFPELYLLHGASGSHGTFEEKGDVKILLDRLIASDLLSNLTLAVLVLVALIRHQFIYIDVALGLAALGYITVITFARYIAEKRAY